MDFRQKIKPITTSSPISMYKYKNVQIVMSKKSRPSTQLIHTSYKQIKKSQYFLKQQNQHMRRLDKVCKFYTYIVSFSHSFISSSDALFNFSISFAQGNE